MGSLKFACLAGSLAFLALPQGALGADFPTTESPDVMRGSYACCESGQDDVLGFEVGLRYIYSYGNHAMTAGGNSYSIEDKSHVLEGHLRIDDNSTDTFLRGSAGFVVNTGGTYSIPGSPNATFEGGNIASAGGDLGWLPLKWGGLRAGFFGGYKYMNESPDMGWTAVPAARTANSLNIHSLRLGISARADIADTVDISADVALVPYAWLTGTYGAFSGGAAQINGGLYGAEGEIMLGYHFTPNAILRVGGRASYLTGQANLTRGGVTTATSALSFTRLGAIAELTYGF